MPDVDKIPVPWNIIPYDIQGEQDKNVSKELKKSFCGWSRLMALNTDNKNLFKLFKRLKTIDSDSQWIRN